MKNKFINWLKGLLGITALQEEIIALKKTIENQSTTISSVRDYNTKLSKTNSQLVKQFDLLVDQTQIGVDVHMSKYNRNPSWAVVCLHGQKEDYVQFIGLKDRDIREIQNFLRPFARDKSCIDAPYGLVPYFKDRNLF